MAVVKWDPFREIEGMQARFNQFFGEPGRMPATTTSFFADWEPAVDVQETEKEYLVKADLPDVKKEDVKVQLDEGVLSVEGERRQEKEEKGKKFHRVERAYGRFVRRFVLPNEVDAANVKAEFKDGVLNVHLPKTEAARAKAVEIKVA
jgi:HSP20 family protein